MSGLLANLGVAIGVLLTGVALLLAVVGSISWFRVGHQRLLWVSVAFALMAVQGVLITVDAYQDRASATFPGLPLVGLLTVISLYLAVLRR